MSATVAEVGERLFRLPDLGEGLAGAEVVAWRVEVGDTVAVDQVVVEVETAKAAVEVPVPFPGVVLRLHAEVGASVAVGEPLISVGSPDSVGRPAEPAPHLAAEPAPQPATEPTPQRTPQPATEPAPRPATEPAAGTGSGSVLVGYGTGPDAPPPRRTRRRRGHAGPAGRAAGTPAGTGAVPPVGTGATPPDPAGTAAPRVISPLVRRLAREHGIDVARLVPSGPERIVLRRDVERALADRDRATTGSPPAPDRAVDERIPLRGLRLAVAEKVTRSRTEIPDVTTWVDVDATDLLTARSVLRAAAPDRGIGLLALLARVCVAGLRRFPELNATVDTGRGEIVRRAHIHLGFAAQTERGLVVPVVHDAHRMTTAELAAELARLTGLARSGGLTPADLTGGTFTLNNFGVFGVDGSTPIINHPEAGMLGVGRIIDRPWVVDGALAVRKVTQLSLSFDHRVCDGGVAGGFLRFVADRVEHPAILLADL